MADLEAPEGAPAFAGDQRADILRLLRQAGPKGVSKSFLIFEKRFTQAAARVWELEQQGHVIRHETRPGDRYVTFVLVSEPNPMPAAERLLEGQEALPF